MFWYIYISLEDFEFLENEPIDNSIFKRSFLEVYHHQGANPNDSNQNVESIFEENFKYDQVGNSHLELDKTVRNLAANFDDNSEIRLVNCDFAYSFKKQVWQQTVVLK